MRERTCYLCSNPLLFEDYIKTNISLEEFIIATDLEFKGKLCKFVFNDIFKDLEIVKLWEEDIVELMCCHCRNVVNLIIKGNIALYKLLDTFQDTRLLKLKALGIVSQEQLIELQRLR